jgi:hypothetical protein
LVLLCYTLDCISKAIYISVKSNQPMQLMMYIGNDLIETVAVDVSRLSIPGYLGGYKRQLKQKYKELLLETAEQAEFLVIQMAPATNKSKANNVATATPSLMSSASYC